MKSLKVKDYMATKLVTLEQQTNVVEAMAILLEHGISGAPVVDDQGQLVGMLSEADIYSVAGQFAAQHRRRYPVVSEGQLVGQISRRDVLRAMEAFLQHEQ